MKHLIAPVSLLILFGLVGFLPAKPPADARTTSTGPIRPPIRKGQVPACDDEPTDAEVLRALDTPPNSTSSFWKVSRDDVEIVKERLVNKIDPVRYFPLVGAAQLHHCYWKCTVHCVETVAIHYPFACRWTQPRIAEIYFDKDHLHLAPSTAP